MKLIRVGERGQEKPAVLKDDKTALAVSTQVRDFDSAFFDSGGLEKLRGLVGGKLPEIALDGKRIGAPVARPYKVIGIGLNYADHAKESGMPIPPEPVIFMKPFRAGRNPEGKREERLGRRTGRRHRKDGAPDCR